MQFVTCIRNGLTRPLQNILGELSIAIVSKLFGVVRTEPYLQGRAFSPDRFLRECGRGRPRPDEALAGTDR